MSVKINLSGETLILSLISVFYKLNKELVRKQRGVKDNIFK